MNKKLEKLAARLYDEGLRAGDAEKIKTAAANRTEAQAGVETEIVIGYLSYYEHLMYEEH